MTIEQVLAGALGGSPAALILLYWVMSANKERRELLDKVLDLSTKTANVNEATRDALKRIDDGIQQIRDDIR